MPELSDPEDQKLVTLARATRARTGAAEGAAVRDGEGRTYAAATVDLPHLSLSAVGVAVAMAVTSGSTTLEAAVVLTEADRVFAEDLDVLRDLAGEHLPVHRCDPQGELRESLTT